MRSCGRRGPHDRCWTGALVPRVVDRRPRALAQRRGKTLVRSRGLVAAPTGRLRQRPRVCWYADSEQARSHLAGTGRIEGRCDLDHQAVAWQAERSSHRCRHTRCSNSSEASTLSGCELATGTPVRATLSAPPPVTLSRLLNWESRPRGDRGCRNPIGKQQVELGATLATSLSLSARRFSAYATVVDSVGRRSGWWRCLCRSSAPVADIETSLSRPGARWRTTSPRWLASSHTGSRGQCVIHASSVSA
jgi:hypothetical protein